MYRFLDRLLNFLTIFAIVLVAFWCVYCLWDDNRVVSQAENIRANLQEHRKSDNIDFQALQAINPDVCAWITIDNTNIDHPLVQGSDNREYLNRDIYGEYAVSGSIFLDTRCSRRLDDNYSLIYGHNIQGKEMFGELSKFKDEDFFEAVRGGKLYTPEATYNLRIIAYMNRGADDELIYNPDRWNSLATGVSKGGANGLAKGVSNSGASALAKGGANGTSKGVSNEYAKEADGGETLGDLLSVVRTKSVFCKSAELQKCVENGEHILALSTCSNEYEGARSILIVSARIV